MKRQQRMLLGPAARPGWWTAVVVIVVIGGLSGLLFGRFSPFVAVQGRWGSSTSPACPKKTRPPPFIADVPTILSPSTVPLNSIV